MPSLSVAMETSHIYLLSASVLFTVTLTTAQSACDKQACLNKLSQSNATEDRCRTIPEVLTCGETTLINNKACALLDRSEFLSYFDDLRSHCNGTCDMATCLKKIPSKDDITDNCRELPNAISCGELTLVNNPNCTDGQKTFITARLSTGRDYLKEHCNAAKCDMAECLSSQYSDDIVALCREARKTILCSENLLANHTGCTEDDKTNINKQLGSSQDFVKTKCNGGSDVTMAFHVLCLGLALVTYLSSIQ